jgi:alpha/beta superfamily hydrolase
MISAWWLLPVVILGFSFGVIVGANVIASDILSYIKH